jgi:peptidoglycan/xylan/chitin deacetylase (PgdA/CDA1 family)
LKFAAQQTIMNFKQASILFCVATFIVLILYYILSISLWWILLPVLVFQIQIIIGSLKIHSNFYGKIYCEGNSSEKEIAISFDDGPNAIYTPKVLHLLKEYNVTASFFVIGKNIEGNEDILKHIDEQGHIIGNHSYSHSFFIDFKMKNGFVEELNQTSDKVFETIGKRMNFFRPPYGVTTPHLVKAAKQLNYQVIGWNVRSLDTTNDDVNTIYKRVLGQLKPNSIVLFHDTSEKTITVLKQTLSFAKENGFKIVSIEKLLRLQAYH